MGRKGRRRSHGRKIAEILAEAGIASRRKSEELIAAGRVQVNGQVVRELGVKIDPAKDKVLFDNKPVKAQETKKVYIMLHKPEGYVTTAKEQFGRPAVLDLVQGVKERIFPVGRLDYDTSGLLLLTNDGDLTYKLTHPKHDVDKTYIAKLYGVPDEGALQKFRRGVVIDGRKTRPAKIQILEKEKICGSAQRKLSSTKAKTVRSEKCVKPSNIPLHS